MKTKRYTTGYTLVELMVAVAIIGLLTMVAIPAYNGYISTSATGAADQNAHSLAGFEDNYFYDNDTYLAGTYDPGNTDTLTGPLEWKPSGDKNNYKYVVTAGSTGSITDSYKVTVTYKPDTSITAVVQKP